MYKAYVFSLQVKKIFALGKLNKVFELDNEITYLLVYYYTISIFLVSVPEYHIHHKNRICTIMKVQSYSYIHYLLIYGTPFLQIGAKLFWISQTRFSLHG
uniref:Uncharacterized protein n=1 Tax=viral metagenome TaxID=1070528 RepID=A0A6C0EHF4_9ZZZZ